MTRSLDLLAAPVELALREVAVAIVDRLELRAVDRDVRPRQKAHRAAQGDKAGTDSPDGGAVLPTELGNGLMIGR